jgi:hypothetical protein
MLLVLASAVFLGSESLGTRHHILLSQIWDFPLRRLLRHAGSRWASRILLHPLGTDHAQRTQPLYSCIAQTAHKTRVTCQTASSLVRYQHWAWCGKRRKQLPILFRVRPCLQRCCPATRWSNPWQYFVRNIPMCINSSLQICRQSETLILY